MPSITIRERDLTSAGNLEVTTNAVYIPGYAIMGPINTPTMCETLEDFQSIFGSKPYKFRAPQSINGISYVIDEYEKSYIMAAELLKMGTPILFERVFTENVDTWTASKILKTTVLTLKAAHPGASSKDIWYKINKHTYNSKNYYTLSVKRKGDSTIGTVETPEIETNFTFDPSFESLEGIKLVITNEILTDNSGLVTLNFGTVGADTDAVNEETVGYTQLQPNLPITGDEFTINGFYNALNATSGTFWDRLKDKGEYVIKYITSGAYPVFDYNSNNITNYMLKTAADRGDCTALIDHSPRSNTAPLVGSGSIFERINTYGNTPIIGPTSKEDGLSYGAMFTPYGIYSCSTVDRQVVLPASYGYLASLSTSLQNNGSWMAIAGVSRGKIPGLLKLCQNVTNAIADSYQKDTGISINPITNIKPYGLTIWGNRTLKNNTPKGGLTATSFLNIRQLTNDVKRTVYVAAKSLTFEQNSDILWINFKSKIIPLLNQMVSGNGLSGYDIKKATSDKKAQLKAVVRLYAIEPVEDWDITIELADNSTTVVG